MPGANKRQPKTRRRSAFNTGKAQSGPPNGATNFLGRLKAPRALLVRSEPIMVWLRGFNAITSTAGGVFSPVYANTDPRTVATDFSNYAGLYSEYRVLGVHVEYQPNAMFSTNNVLITGQPLAIGTQRASLASAGNYAAVTTLPDAHLRSVNQPWTMEVRAQNVAEMAYIPVGTDASSTFAIKVYADSYAANTNYGSTLVTYCVQFFGRF